MESLEPVKSAADELIKSDRYMEAVNLYSEWLREKLRVRVVPKKPDNESLAFAYNNRGHAKYLMVDFDGAVSDYNKGLTYNSTLPVLYYNRGTIMYRMGYFEKAAVDMLVAARLQPDSTEFRVALQKTLTQLQVNDKCFDKGPPLQEEEDLNEDEDVEILYASGDGDISQPESNEGGHAPSETDINTAIPMPKMSRASTRNLADKPQKRETKISKKQNAV